MGAPFAGGSRSDREERSSAVWQGEWSRAPRFRFPALVMAALLAGWVVAPAPAKADLTGDLLKSAGVWVLEEFGKAAIGKVVDLTAAQVFGQRLEQQVPPLVQQIADTTGEKREALQEQLGLVRDQLAILSRTSSLNAAKIAQIRADQKSLLDRVKRVTARVAKLEGRVDDIEARVGQLEEALISQCLDRRRAPLFGEDGFRVSDKAGSRIDDSSESDSASLAVHLFLNSCTHDLTQRGLLIQLTAVTRGLEGDMNLYATFKDAASAGYEGYTRLEFPLSRPSYRLDGQVREMFIPYSEIPFPSGSGRLALALVVTHDGEIIYRLADRVLSCVFAQQVNCRWGT